MTETDTRSSKTKRFDKYPRLAAFARSLPPETLSFVIAWHQTIVDGLRYFIDKYPTEGRTGGNTPSENYAAVQALKSYLFTMQDVRAMLSDLRPADWCCAKGAIAYPAPCPTHGGAQIGEVRWRDGQRQVWLADGWHYLGRRVKP